ncbi:uncharacterized protein [Lolium perenne]|uniref:uncharacterized protein n=1 Tax=Lolium perenne TaxID=4522 RepID=UPI0021EA70BB|nr:protein IQ-DOMAIN 14-like [Lolium perenne]
MGRTRAMCCLMPSKPSGDTRRRSSAACICCIGPHHRPSGGSTLAPVDAENSVMTPLTSCCGTGGAGNVVRAGRSGTRTPRTPKTPCTPSARRLCGVRSRTPRRTQQARRFAAPETAPAAAVSPAPARTPRTPSTPIGRTQRVCCITSGGAPAQGRAKTTSGTTRRSTLSSASKAVAQTTPRNAAHAVAATVRDTTTTTPLPRANGGDVAKAYTPPLEVVKAAAKEPAREEESVCSNEEYALLCREGFAREDVAAVTIQAYFRAHLARRAFKALKSLVRLQAVARGAYVRRQAEVAVSCMQAMARLQARVRARQTTLGKPKPKPEDNDGDKLLLQS